jgi:hypothetical protein
MVEKRDFINQVQISGAVSGCEIYGLDANRSGSGYSARGYFTMEAEINWAV